MELKRKAAITEESPSLVQHLEKPVRSAEIKTELLTTKGPKLLAFADNIDVIGDTILSIKDMFGINQE